MPGDDGRLYVLSTPGESPQRFGHMHGGSEVEFSRGVSTTETTEGIFRHHRVTPFTCPSCGEEVSTSEPLNT